MVLFIGHGSPMNAIEDNEFSRGWREAGKALPRPTAILCVSAHWERWGTLVTAMERPRTIHDFGGFPRALFEAQYPAPGSKWLAQEAVNEVRSVEVGLTKIGAWITAPERTEADVPGCVMSCGPVEPDYTRRRNTNTT
jgi:4,5-DOPA dioxygenase extradiol